MELSEILKSIQPCDMELPYVFISYSAKDSERVWQDVLKFQQMGYNVWLDEKNLDKTQPSWRSDALNAIRDMNCSLMVFYVSRHSLVSHPCYSELACTVEDYTKAVHFGPVKFVAVDVEPIADIVEFSREVYLEIRKKDIPKADKTTQAVTLNSCIEQFFNSNNEKVRVKPFGIPNRKMDYYEEIVASFPDDTRVLEPVVIPEPEPVVIPKPVAAPEPVVVPKPAVAPEPVVAPEPAVAPEPDMQEHGAWAEDRPTFKYHVSTRTTLSRNSIMLAEKAMEAGTEMLKKCKVYGAFIPYRNLSEKQRKNAVIYIAKGEKEEDILGMLDASLFDNGKDGIVLTRTALYYKWNGQPPVDLEKLREVHEAGKNHIRVVYADGRCENLYFSIFFLAAKALLDVYAEANKIQ